MKLKIRAMELRLKSSDLARDLGVTNSTVTVWLRGDRDIPLEHVVSVARWLRLPIKEVLSPIALAVVEAVERENQLLNQEQASNA